MENVRVRKERVELNSFEWTIYNIIKGRSEQGLWTTQSELNTQLFLKGYDVSTRMTRKHIQFIKKNDKIQKIIMSNTKLGYKLMSDEEELKYLEAKRIEALGRLKRFWKDYKRFEQNGQGKITFGQYEREYIESLVGER